MNTKRKCFKAAVGLSAGAIILSCAVFANYDNANSYANCKTAVKNVLHAENKSVDYTTEIKLDGKNLFSCYGSYKLNANGNPSCRDEITYETDGNVEFTLNQFQDSKQIYKGISNGGKHSYGYYYDSINKPKTVINELNGDGNNFGDKAISFIETVADVLVGDLKNNFVLTETRDGMSKYSLSLTRDQMPAYVNSGVSLAASLVTDNVNKAGAEADNSSYSDAETADTAIVKNFFGSEEPYVKGIDFSVWLDENSNPGDLSCTIGFIGFDEDGNEHMISLNTNAAFYDFGSTEIERISDEELSEMQYMEGYGEYESTMVITGED